MPSLPPTPGFDDVSGAVCRGTWAFCWRDGDAAFWSAATGWLCLPPSPRPILNAIGTDDGLALLRSESTVEFREWGRTDPAWTCDLDVPYGDAVHLAASFVVHGTRDNVATAWTAEEIRPDGLAEPVTFVAPKREPPLALLRRPGSLPLLAVVPEGIADVPAEGGTLAPRTVGSIAIDGPTRLAALPRTRPDVALFHLRTGTTLLLRLSDASCEVLGLRAPAGFEEIWCGALAGDVAAVARILSIYLDGPPPMAGEGPLACLGLVLDDAGLPAAALTHEGLIELPFRGKPAGSRPRRAWAPGSAAAEDVLAWRLLAGEDGAFDPLVDALLSPGPSTRSHAIGFVLARERPSIAGRALLEKARGRAPSEKHRESESAFSLLLGEASGIPDAALLESVSGQDPFVATIAAIGLCGRWVARKGEAGVPGPTERAAVLALLEHEDPVVRGLVLGPLLEAGVEVAPERVLSIFRASSERACNSLLFRLALRNPDERHLVEAVFGEARQAPPDSPLRHGVTSRPLLEYLYPGPAAVPVALGLMAGVVDHRLSSLVGLLAIRGPWVSLPQAIEAIAAILSCQIQPTELPESRNASTFSCLLDLAEGWGREPSTEPGETGPGRPLSPVLLAASLSTILFARAWNAGGLNWKEPSERALLRRTGRHSGDLEPLVAGAEDALSANLPALAKLARLCGVARRLDGRLGALLACSVLLAPLANEPAELPAGASLASRLRQQGERHGPKRELLRLAEFSESDPFAVGDLVRRSLESIRLR